MEKHQDNLVRVEVGFDGGQLFVARLDPKNLETLTKAARRDDGWVEFQLEDGQVSLDASKITYIRSELEEGKIGFAGA